MINTGIRSFSHRVRFISESGLVAEVISETDGSVYTVHLAANWDHRRLQFNGACDCADYVYRRHSEYTRGGVSQASQCKHIKTALSEFARSKVIQESLKEHATKH